jgi:carbamoyl-phosphate synthase small subunit
MTGYQEIVTDPSFAEQLVCFTAPMIGNYGVDRARSSRPGRARAVLMRRRVGRVGPMAARARHRRAHGHDTRSLVLQLRSAGAMRAVAVSGDCAVDEALATARSLAEMNGRALVAGVRTKEPYIFSDIGPTRVAVVDYGCKRSILRRLAHAGAAVTVYPHDVDADELVGYDGVLLSNGPGDPEPLELEIATVRSCSAGCPCSESASGTSCSVAPRASAPRSSRSDTEARTIPCSSGRTVVYSSRRRTTASASTHATRPR